MKKCFFLLVLLISVQAHSQDSRKLKSFSQEFSVYLEELREIMLLSKNKESSLAFHSFHEVVDSDILSKYNQDAIIDISNKMLEKKLRINPYFLQFLKSFSVLSKDSEKISEWIEVVQQMLYNASNKDLLLFFHFTYSLVSTHSIRYSKNVRWVLSNNQYKFLYKNSEPLIKFSSFVNLKCMSEGGSFEIYNTKGEYYPKINKWYGTYGFVNWKKGYTDQDSLYVELQTYQIDSRESELVADSVLFYNKLIFLNPIFGELRYKITIGKQAATYPRFTSYDRNLEVLDIFPNIDYKGRFKMLGQDFVADGGRYSDARIIFKRNGRPIFTANSNRFNIKDNKISAQHATVKIFFDKDSIYHSDVQFKYLNNERLLELYRDRSSSLGGPMFNTYHQLTIDFELLQWYIDKDIITFGSLPGNSLSSVYFESTDLYLEERFNSLQGIDRIHPLFLINQYVESKKEESFYVLDFAKFSGYPLHQIQPYLMNLANQGFLFYNTIEDRVIIQNSFKRYIEAKNEKSDYDLIRFNSTIKSDIGLNSSKNAALNIKTKDLMIRGVEDVFLSDVQDVYLKPRNSRIIIKKNRDITFSGRISIGSGRFNLFGEKFSFNYDEFKINLYQIDSLQLYVPVQPVRRDMYGNEVLIKVKTVIEGVTGELKIDDPNNKSGLKKDSFPQYPIFRSFSDSYTYYDGNDIFDGIYNRKDFSFHLSPFEIDSLENYTISGLKFAGVFKSNIFPEFDDTLYVQEDYSLGFKHITSSNGFSIYNNKAQYYDTISLSNSGLRGSGTLEYLTTSMFSNDIFFFPDSANLRTKLFAITKQEDGIEFPSVSNTSTDIHYMPYDDELEVKQIKAPFDFYNKKGSFIGDILVKPVGLSGNGKIELDKATLSSRLFIFNAVWFSSDTADLQVFEDNGNIGFQAKNLRSHIDLSDRIGIFYSNGIGSFVEFPANQYICYIDELNWDIDNQSIALGSDSNTLDIGSEFISLHPEQDSLSFFSQTATYKLSDYLIHADGVQEIYVADAIIYPDSSSIIIDKEAYIHPLYRSKITITNRRDTFFNSNIQIKGAYHYQANGSYTYLSDSSIQQTILFDDIHVNKHKITVGTAEILDDSLFMIDKKHQFKGIVSFSSDIKDLFFDGYFKIKHNCSFNNQWISFRSEINPNELIFSLDSLIYNDKKEILLSGFCFNIDSLDIYSAFFSKKRKKIDKEMLIASNRYSYNSQESKYVIGNPESTDNFLILYEEDCIIEASGDINISLDLGRVNIKSSASIISNPKEKKKEIDGLFIFNFHFSEDAMKIMAEDIFAAPGDKSFIYDDTYTKNLSRIVGDELAENLVIDLELTDEFKKFPSSMNYPLVFTKVKFNWDSNTSSYIAKGNIGLGNIYDNQLHSILDGYIVLKKGKRKDELTIYLQTEFYDTYYFNYRNGVMKAFSTTNDNFNNIIREVSDNRKRVKQKSGKKPYRYQLASEGVVEKFYNRMQKTY